MSDEIKDANLELLIGLKQHLEQAERLRAALDRLLSLARVGNDVSVRDCGKPTAKREVSDD